MTEDDQTPGPIDEVTSVKDRGKHGMALNLLQLPVDLDRPKSPGGAKLTPFQRKKIDFMFDTLYGPTDADVVSREDFGNLLKTASIIRDITPSHPQFRELQMQLASIWAGIIKGTIVYKVDRSRLVMEINREEWHHYWGDFVEAAALVENTWPELSKDGRVDYRCQKDFTDFMFNIMDVNGDGHLDKDEYIKCMASFGILPVDSDDSFDRILTYSKRNLDDPEHQLIDFSFFELLWFQYLTSQDEREPGNYLLGPKPVYS